MTGIPSSRPGHGARWTDESDGELRRLVGEGRLLPEIARAMGRTQEACRSRANILKIPVRSTDRSRRVGFHGEGLPGRGDSHAGGESAG